MERTGGAAAAVPARAGATATKASPASRAGSAKLGYLEKREWEEMEPRILEAEAALVRDTESAADPAVASDHKRLAQRLHAVASAQAAVDQLYARWAELEAKLKG